MNQKYKLAFYLLFVLSIAIVSLMLIFIYSSDIAVLSPRGIIALKERNLIIIPVLLMLIVVIPVFIMTILFSWKYRASNKAAIYSPNWDYSFFAEVIWWGIPFVIILLLSIITWTSSHELDPFRPIEVENKQPLRIQVVALQWKWLFLYPEQQIATVNVLHFPEKTPINFEITADAPMNSFWIPQLSGQIYAMPGMRTTLYLMAGEPGQFRGSSANLSGVGFAGMTFMANATTEADFDKWVQSVKQSSNRLGFEEYDQLVKPSKNNPVASFLLNEEGLFDRILMKYMPSMPAK